MPIELVVEFVELFVINSDILANPPQTQRVTGCQANAVQKLRGQSGFWARSQAIRPMIYGLASPLKSREKERESGTSIAVPDHGCAPDAARRRRRRRAAYQIRRWHARKGDRGCPPGRDVHVLPASSSSTATMGFFCLFRPPLAIADRCLAAPDVQVTAAPPSLRQTRRGLLKVCTSGWLRDAS